MNPGSEPFDDDAGIPEILHSSFEGGPFRRCVDCGTDLFEDPLPYAVEKVVRHGEVVFEYALCASCSAQLLSQYSEESLKNLGDYVRQNPVFDLDAESDPPDRCHHCGRDGHAFQEEHTVMGMLAGHQLLVGVNTLCGSCAEGVESVLSEKTREVNGDFVDRTFPGVPAGLDIPLTLGL